MLEIASARAIFELVSAAASSFRPSAMEKEENYLQFVSAEAIISEAAFFLGDHNSKTHRAKAISSSALEHCIPLN
jgi:hypothetical protein